MSRRYSGTSVTIGSSSVIVVCMNVLRYSSQSNYKHSTSTTSHLCVCVCVRHPSTSLAIRRHLGYITATGMQRCSVPEVKVRVRVKVKVHTLDIASLRSESPPQKRSDKARVLKGFHSFSCIPTCSSAIGMSHTCLCLPSYSWYSFTDPEGTEGRV